MIPVSAILAIVTGDLMNRPSSKDIFQKSEEILMLKPSPGFTTFCNDIWWLATENDPEPKKFFDQIRRNYPGWEKPDFAALYFTLTGENPGEK